MAHHVHSDPPQCTRCPALEKELAAEIIKRLRIEGQYEELVARLETFTGSVRVRKRNISSVEDSNTISEHKPENTTQKRQKLSILEAVSATWNASLSCILKTRSSGSSGRLFWGSEGGRGQSVLSRSDASTDKLLSPESSAA